MSTLTIVTARSVPLTGSLAVLFEAREAIGLVLLGERFDEVIDVAVHTPVQVREVVSEAVEVWMRPCASVAGTRCPRCTPDSNLSFEYAPRPETLKMISLKPPFSDWLCERISVFQRWRSAYRAYIR